MKNIISKLILIIALTGMPFAVVNADVQIIDEVIAQVNDSVITRSQLIERIQHIQAASQQNKQPVPDNVEQLALDELILETIQLDIAKRINYDIPMHEIEQRITQLASDQNLSLEQFKALLQERGVSYEDYANKMRRELIIRQVQQGNLREEVLVSDQELDDYLKTNAGEDISLEQYRMLNILLPNKSSAKDLAFMNFLKKSLEAGEVSLQGIIKKQRFDEQPLQVSDSGWISKNSIKPHILSVVDPLQARDISSAFADENGSNLILLIDKRAPQKIIVDQVRARHILITTNEIRNAAAAQALAADLHQQIIDGADFAELARLYSDDKGSAAQGGVLDWADPDIYAPAFKEALVSLDVNELSAPVKSEFGWHIIEKLDTRKYDASQDIIRNRARQILTERKFQEALQDWLTKIRQDAYIQLKKK